MLYVRILISAGEASGEMYGAHAVSTRAEELQRRVKAAQAATPLWTRKT